MGKYYYHPMGENALKSHIFTYPGGHEDGGKLDINYSDGSIEGEPFYAIADGEIVFCGTWSDGTVAIVQKCTDSKLGKTFYIRYLHGKNNSSLLGQNVSKGTQLGTVSNNEGVYSSHLHIDFSTIQNDYAGIIGSLDRTNSTWTYDGTTHNLISKIDYNTIDRWESEGGFTDDNVGYLWLLFAQNATYLTPSSFGNYNEAMDISSQLSDDDWNALYGLIAYEESVLFDDFDTNEVYRAILEWIIRVFRNRLFSGISINSICVWDTLNNSPGYNRCLELASSVPDNIKNFAKDIISGRDKFLVEKYAEQYRYDGWSNDNQWYDRLYSANTFYGGNSARSGFATLAQIPFPRGPYFFFEGDLSSTEKVRTKFWPNGLDGQSAYPNPYRIKGSSSTTDSVLSAAKTITTLHYQNALTNGYKLDGTGAQYYNQGAYLDTTYSGTTIHSRRDCSGFVCGMWQILGDGSPNLSTATFKSQHPSNWNVISLSGLSVSDLRPGDVIFREGASHGFSDGHTEIIKSISGNTIYSYGFGSDNGLLKSYQGTQTLDSINNYDYILRRN